MKRIFHGILSACIAVTFFGCDASDPEQNTNLNDVEMQADDGNYNVVIEISAGSREKWEVNKETAQLERDTENGRPRTIHYLGYPANYGYIPKTILPKDLGGDGDPLDVIVLGDPIDRGTVASAKPLGMLKLLDRGEQDDKILMVQTSSEFAQCQSLEELNNRYPEICTIIETWFVHYKGPDTMKSLGWYSEKHAVQQIQAAGKHYKTKHP